MKSTHLFAFATACVLSGAAAAAIPGLKNTGAGLAANAMDTNYTFEVVVGTATGSACGLSSCGFVARDAGFPFGPWIAPDNTNLVSNWLTPSTNQAQNYDPLSDGVYRWTLKFDLTNFIPSTASFAGRFAADNGSSVYLNGSTTPLATTSYPLGFSAWTSFSANSGFVAGENSLVFEVRNKAQGTGNPTGLRVEFIESAVTPVPEPEAYGLALAGMGVVAFAMRRRRDGREEAFRKVA